MANRNRDNGNGGGKGRGGSRPSQSKAMPPVDRRDDPASNKVFFLADYAVSDALDYFNQNLNIDSQVLFQKVDEARVAMQLVAEKVSQGSRLNTGPLRLKYNALMDRARRFGLSNATSDIDENFFIAAQAPENVSSGDGKNKMNVAGLSEQDSHQMSEKNRENLDYLKSGILLHLTKLSRREFWKPRPKLQDDEISFWGLSSDRERLAILRQKMREFPNGVEAFERIKAQMIIDREALGSINRCFAVLKDKTPEQIEFLLGSTPVEVEEEDDDMPSSVDVLNDARDTAGIPQGTGENVEVADVADQGDRGADNKNNAEKRPDVVRDTAGEMKEEEDIVELKKDLQGYIAVLSRINIWKKNPGILSHESSLYAFGSDEDRRSYILEQLRLFPHDDRARRRLLAQAVDPHSTGRPLFACKEILKGKTPEQIEFLLGPTTTEAEGKEGGMSSPVDVLNDAQDTADTRQGTGENVEVADVTVQDVSSFEKKNTDKMGPDVVQGTAGEMKEEEDIVELKEDLQGYIAVLSRKDIWKKNPELLLGEPSLHAFILYEDRKSYLRQQMRLLSRDENILSRLLAQAVDPHSTEISLFACKEILKDKTPEQIEFLLGPTTVEVEYDQDSLDSINPFHETNNNVSKVDGEIEEPENLPKIEIPISKQDREPGAMPDPEDVDPSDRPTDVSEPKRFQDSRESVFSRAKSWIKGRVDDAQNSDFYRAQMKGEYLPQDFEKASPPSYGVMIGAAVGSAAMSAFGVAIIPDAIRYATQRIYSDKERKELNETLKAIRVAEMAAESRRATAEKKEQVVERVHAMQKRIQESRYLTPSQKDELLAKLGSASVEHTEATKGPDEQAQREIGRILEHAIRPRISGEKVKKEALNTLLMASGFHVLRAPAYGALSLYERWRKLTREKPESPAGERFRSAITNGFSDWWDNARGNKGRLTQAAAFGTAARFVGMGGVLVESIGENSEEITRLFKAWSERLPQVSLSDLGISERSFDGMSPDTGYAEAPPLVALETSQGVAPAVPSVDQFTRPDFNKLFERIPEDVDSEDDSLADEEEDSSDDEPTPDIALDPSRIPDEAIIRRGDGITHALLVAIEADPSLLKATDHVLFTDEQLSPLFLRRLAMQEGLLDYWVNDKAIGNLAVVPLYTKDDVLTIGFLNPETGERYSVQELKDLGWLTKAPRS